MFLSKLTLNPYHRAVRRDLANPYALHQTLARAFPDADEGGPGRVLFRVEWPRESSPFVLVQSDKLPTWDELPSDYLNESGTKPLDELVFQAGQRLHFRLRANPARRLGSSADPRWQHKRVGLCREEEQRRWLDRKGAEGGFRIGPQGCQVIPEGMIVARKPGHELHFQAVRFEGTLEVLDPEHFGRTLAEGIGPAKGLGFGLLSVAPLE
jgi:CRISPR system Cascade subunit CasE